jgi:hypothetical protein
MIRKDIKSRKLKCGLESNTIFKVWKFDFMEKDMEILNVVTEKSINQCNYTMTRLMVLNISSRKNRGKFPF